MDLAAIEAILLDLVGKETGETVEQLRAAGIRYPQDPPWDSRAFVNLEAEIEERFGLQFTDIFAAEKASRRLDTMVAYIHHLLLAQRIAGTG